MKLLLLVLLCCSVAQAAPRLALTFDKPTPAPGETVVGTCQVTTDIAAPNLVWSYQLPPRWTLTGCTESYTVTNTVKAESFDAAGVSLGVWWSNVVTIPVTKT